MKWKPFFALAALVILVVAGVFLFLQQERQREQRPPEMPKQQLPPEASKQQAQVRISVNSWIGFGPLYLAKSEGLFEKHGLKVEITKIEAGPDRRAALIANRVDLLGASLDDFAVTVDQGVDAVAVSCADFSNGADAILVSKEIHSLKELTRVPIAVEPGLPNHFFLLYVLDKAGLKTDSLKILPMQPDNAGAAFIAGHLNAAVTWEPHISQALKERSGAHVLASSDKYPEAILDLFIARKEWAVANLDSLDRFRAVWDEAVASLSSNPSKSHAILARELGLQPGEIGNMLSGVTLLSNDRCRQLIEPQIGQLGKTVERLWKQAGYLKNDIDLASRMQLR